MGYVQLSFLGQLSESCPGQLKPRKSLLFHSWFIQSMEWVYFRSRFWKTGVCSRAPPSHSAVIGPLVSSLDKKGQGLNEHWNWTTALWPTQEPQSAGQTGLIAGRIFFFLPCTVQIEGEIQNTRRQLAICSGHLKHFEKKSISKKLIKNCFWHGALLDMFQHKSKMPWSSYNPWIHKFIITTLASPALK